MKRRLSPGRRPAIAAAAAVVVVVGTSLAAAAAAAGPAAAQTKQTEYFTAFLALRASSAQPAWSAATADGAFGARGTLHFGANGPHGVHHDILIFQKGTIDLAEVGKTDTFTFNPKTCVGSDHETGTYQVTGTGQYANVTGSGSWQHNATIVAPLQSRCTASSPGTVGFVRFAGSGPISLGG
jgi:hypothetical protein